MQISRLRVGTLRCTIVSRRLRLSLTLVKTISRTKAQYRFPRICQRRDLQNFYKRPEQKRRLKEESSLKACGPRSWRWSQVHSISAGALVWDPSDIPMESSYPRDRSQVDAFRAWSCAAVLAGGKRRSWSLQWIHIPWLSPYIRWPKYEGGFGELCVYELTRGPHHCE